MDEQTSQTPVVSINPCKIEEEFVEQAASALKEGSIVIFPTDTVYGIGMLATPEVDPRVLFASKNRPENKNLPLLIANLKTFDLMSADTPQYAKELAMDHWPGPLTLVVKASDAVPEQLRAPDGSIALRIPAHDVTLALLKAAGTPIITSSANMSGEEPAHSVPELAEELKRSVDLIIDGGDLPGGAASTVVSCLEEEPHVLRPGPITL